MRQRAPRFQKNTKVAGFTSGNGPSMPLCWGYEDRGDYAGAKAVYIALEVATLVVGSSPSSTAHVGQIVGVHLRIYGGYMAHEETVDRLIKLAAQMARRVGMPYDSDDDWQFPKAVSIKQRSRIYHQVEAAHEQCRQWAIAVRECADSINRAPCAKVDSQTPTNTQMVAALGFKVMVIPGLEKTYLLTEDQLRKVIARLNAS